jgi:succinate-semialdehyde dehydrogenase / glutarate-semialdehyde dehydrogenase
LNEEIMAIESINPTTGEVLARYEAMTPTVAKIIDAAHEALLIWRGVPYAERAGLMRKAAVILHTNAKDYARLMAQEMGKPVRDGVAEAQKCALAGDFYADNAERFLAPEPVATEATKSYVTFNPLGVVLAVMPWNFPFWQVFRFAAPGLMAGNAAVLKHASNVPGCALAIETIFRDAGFPENLFRTLLVGSQQVEAVIEHPRVKAATLTGSRPGGRSRAKPARC